MFAKTGSGQIQEQLKQTKTRFCIQLGQSRQRGPPKTPTFEPFYTKNDHFAKTGSGQT
jgi:hypothetical protein